MPRQLRKNFALGAFSSALGIAIYRFTISREMRAELRKVIGRDG